MDDAPLAQRVSLRCQSGFRLSNTPALSSAASALAMSSANSSVQIISHVLPVGLNATSWNSQSWGHLGAFNGSPRLVSMTVIPFASVSIGIARSSIVIVRLFSALNTGQPRNINCESFLFREAKLSCQRIWVDFVKRHFSKVFYNEKKKTIGQSRGDIIFLRSRDRLPVFSFKPLTSTARKSFSVSFLNLKSYPHPSRVVFSMT